MSESDTPADKVEHKLLQWGQLCVLGLILSQVAQSFAVELGGVALAVLSIGVFLKRARSRNSSEVAA